MQRLRNSVLDSASPAGTLIPHTRVQLENDGARHLSSGWDGAPPQLLPLLWRRRQPLQTTRAQPPPPLLAGRHCRGELGGWGVRTL